MGGDLWEVGEEGFFEVLIVSWEKRMCKMICAEVLMRCSYANLGMYHVPDVADSISCQP